MVNIIFAIFVAILFVRIVSLYSIFVKNKKIKIALVKRENEIKYLSYLTTQAVSDDLSIKERFPVYLNVLKETVGWMAHSLWRLDEKRQVLPIRFTGYLPQWYIDELSTKLLVRVGDGSVGRAVQIKQPVIINIARSSDPRFARFTSLSDRTGYKCLSGHPVMARLKTYGALCNYGINENMFKLHDAQFLLTCANLYGAILESKLLRDYLERKT